MILSNCSLHLEKVLLIINAILILALVVGVEQYWILCILSSCCVYYQ